MRKTIAVLILVSLAVLGCGKTQKAKETKIENMTENAWESADALKGALQELYGFECEASGADGWGAGSPAYFLTGYTKNGEPYINVDIAYDESTNRVIYMEWYFDPEKTTAKERKEAVCTALRDPDDIQKTTELLDMDPLPDYEEKELSDCMLYVMTVEENGYTALCVQFTDIS